jgi:hypothetical protein
MSSRNATVRWIIGAGVADYRPARSNVRARPFIAPAS